MYQLIQISYNVFFGNPLITHMTHAPKNSIQLALRDILLVNMDTKNWQQYFIKQTHTEHVTDRVTFPGAKNVYEYKYTNGEVYYIVEW